MRLIALLLAFLIVFANCDIVPTPQPGHPAPLGPGPMIGHGTGTP